MKEEGLTLIEMNYTNQMTLNEYLKFLDKASVKDVVELKKGVLLAMTQIPPDYFIIDLQKQKVIRLGTGFGEAGLSLTLLPGFDYQNYPYVFCKEQGTFAIFDPVHNLMS